MRIAVNKTYKLIQVMGALYRYITYTAFTYNDIFTGSKKLL